eukprot:TRINITY_DN499_c0_g1_i24.p1 TRINITY_DN499_c0_g1~~TRINITY_DN499_c0_g1_i24.p1  ORF type:complete len:511 (+),score=183.47 TRINITY_DN499_c0_g1_i24:353-1885(+)
MESVTEATWSVLNGFSKVTQIVTQLPSTVSTALQGTGQTGYNYENPAVTDGENGTVPDANTKPVATVTKGDSFDDFELIDSYYSQEQQEKAQNAKGESIGISNGEVDDKPPLPTGGSQTSLGSSSDDFVVIDSEFAANIDANGVETTEKRSKHTDDGEGGEQVDKEDFGVEEINQTFVALTESMRLDDWKEDGDGRGPVLDEETWAQHFNADGSINNVDELKGIIFYGGVDPEIRGEVWPFLLGHYDWESTYDERKELRQRKAVEYQSIKLQWTSITAEQEQYHSQFRDRKFQIEKDVIRTDRDLPFFEDEHGDNLKKLSDILMTYGVFNFDLSYVQGMNDLLAPILYNIGDESESFWCFKHHMDSVMSNFASNMVGLKDEEAMLYKLLELAHPKLWRHIDEKSMGTGMLFCVRWLLLRFKREFEYEDAMRLWEMLWTDYITPKFHLFVAVAILFSHADEILGDNLGQDEVLMFVINLQGNIDLETTLVQAENIFNIIKEDPTFNEVFHV